MDLSQVKKGGTMKPPRVLIYGPAGIGKTTFGAEAPRPIFLPIEDGLGKLDVDSFPTPGTYSDALAALKSLIQEEHEFKSIIVDSLDWLEPLIWSHTCEQNGFKSIEAPGYGKGYVEALKYWREFLDHLNYLRDTKKMAVVLIGHSIIREFKSPDTDSFDRYQIKLQQKAADLVSENSDAIFFANYKTQTIKTEGRTGVRNRAVGTGERVMFTEERPAWLAKNRYGLPAEMALNWAEFMKGLKGQN